MRNFSSIIFTSFNSANGFNLILSITGTGTDIHQPSDESTMDMPP